jgi:hypothetical protein
MQATLNFIDQLSGKTRACQNQLVTCEPSPPQLLPLALAADKKLRHSVRGIKPSIGTSNHPLQTGAPNISSYAEPRHLRNDPDISRFYAVIQY